MDDHLARMAEEFGDRTAFAVVDVGSMTFAEWDGAANAMARRLVDAGLEPGARVGIHLRPELALHWLVSYSAAHRAGGVAVPMNPRLAPAEVAHMLEHSGATAVVADGDLLRSDGEIGAGRLVALIDAGAEGGTPPPDSPVLSWGEVTSGDRTSFQVPRESEDLADILYTSGTTGRPKGVAVRHSNGSMIGAVEPNWSGAGWVHASPLFTFAGIALVYTPMKLGLQVIYQPRFDADRWLRVVEEEHPMAVFLVPTMAHLLIDHPRFADADLSSVQMCSVGSAPLAPFVVERLQEKMPDALVSNNYGMTEAGSAYCVMPKGEAVKRPAQWARSPRPRWCASSTSTTSRCPPTRWARYGCRCPGASASTSRTPRRRPRCGGTAGWSPVTSASSMRTATSTSWAAPRTSSSVVATTSTPPTSSTPWCSMTAVKEVAVVGAPHPVLGEDVVAFVVLHPGAEADSEELRAFGLEYLADYKVPRQFVFIDELPRNPTGKVVKPELRARVAGTPA